MIDEILTCPVCGRKYKHPFDRCEVDGAPLYGPEVLARLGQEVNNYKIHDILGEGGMGVVYRGEHIMLSKPVAIKILHDRFARRKGAATQFLREARAASRIRHPNIVDVTDFGKAPDGSIYFVMEFLEGESLEDVLARDGRVPHFSAVNIVNQIARALGAAHEHGIVHQDLKPDNVYLTSRAGRRRIVRRDEDTGFVIEPEGDFEFVKLLDFGVAKFNEDNLGPGLTAKTGMVFGTPHYMSPEQAQGLPVDPRSDIYALGILFYEMLTGVVPFDGDAALDILNGHVSGYVKPPAEVDARIRIDRTTNDTILRCLEKKPAKRFQTMEDLCVSLRDCFTDRVYLRDAAKLPGAVEAGIVPPPTPDRPPTKPPEPEPRKKRLTEELGELFGGDGNAAGGDEGAQIMAKREQPTMAAKPTPTGGTTPGLQAVRVPISEHPSGEVLMPIKEHTLDDLLPEEAEHTPIRPQPSQAQPSTRPASAREFDDSRVKTNLGLAPVSGASPRRDETQPGPTQRKRKGTAPLATKKVK
ncbi:MAG: serine/threonine protein kinase [Myxococcales bacterium]|nr:serine/threonine protein kinase [Myxococcales bacterium]